MKLLRINSLYQKVQRQFQMQKFKETGLSVAQAGVHVDSLGKKSVLSTYSRETLNRKQTTFFGLSYQYYCIKNILMNGFHFLNF